MNTEKKHPNAHDIGGVVEASICGQLVPAADRILPSTLWQA